SLKLGLWIDPPRALEIVRRLRKALEAVPFLDPRQVRRWRDAETLLQPFARCQRAAVAAGTGGTGGTAGVAGGPAAPPAPVARTGSAESFSLEVSGCGRSH
ncbi:MAG TPA: hypothetical protein VMM92_15295, partial [Thermoanaerobaculia bacterium]|nr:hypothetical protein [Thermoanaerobaculia bacterium]